MGPLIHARNNLGTSASVARCGGNTWHEEMQMSRQWDQAASRSLCAALFLFVLGLGVPSASAQTPGVTDNRILIGSCSPLDGPARFLGNQTVMGATAYLHSV